MNHIPNQTCSNCHCWVGPKTPDDPNGYCCAQPPVRLPEPPEGLKAAAAFPTTAPTTWCAQWRTAQLFNPAPVKPVPVHAPEPTETKPTAAKPAAVAKTSPKTATPTSHDQP